MLINETPPNVRRIATDRDDVLAFEVSGQIASSDIENLYGLLDGAVSLHDSVDVIVIVHDYEGVDWSGMSLAETFTGKSSAFRHVRRIALVGAEGWISAGMRLATLFTSIEVRQFSQDEATAAWEWIGAKPLAHP
ncbi:STAS/SEC14 domain-containing protein [Chelativorans composti]|jgi:Protein of unknown function (DUF3478).|uniref:STAS/SEC14 domain-containing protein n=1 Tax=Chelativorans composti TaxID=768533 RepID=A0ABW5DJX0_9HYPH